MDVRAPFEQGRDTAEPTQGLLEVATGQLCLEERLLVSRESRDDLSLEGDDVGQTAGSSRSRASEKRHVP